MTVHRLPLFSQESFFVYAMFCQDEDGPGYVKFGRSRQVTKRLTALRTSCPIPAKLFAIAETENQPKCEDLEKALHRTFKTRRVTGEWYKFDFASKEDKRAFNDGCFKAFYEAECTRKWVKINVAELDEYNRRRRIAFMKKKGNIKAFNYRNQNKDEFRKYRGA